MNMTKKKCPDTFLEFCDVLTPCIVRAMAVKNGRLLTHFEIAAASGLPARTVQRLASTKSWKHVKIGTASAFLRGCGVDMLDRSSLSEFVEKYADLGFPHMNTKQKQHFFKIVGWTI